MGEDGHEGWDRRMDSPEKDLLVTYIIKFKKALNYIFCVLKSSKHHLRLLYIIKFSLPTNDAKGRF